MDNQKAFPIRTDDATMARFRRLAGGRGETQNDFIRHCLNVIESLERLDQPQRDLVRDIALRADVAEGTILANLAIENLAMKCAEWRTLGLLNIHNLAKSEVSPDGSRQPVTGAHLFWTIEQNAAQGFRRQLADQYRRDAEMGVPLTDEQRALMEVFYPPLSACIAKAEDMLEMFQPERVAK